MKLVGCILMCVPAYLERCAGELILFFLERIVLSMRWREIQCLYVSVASERGVNALQAYLQLVPRNGAALISMFRNMNGIGLYRYPSIKLRVIIRDL